MLRKCKPMAQTKHRLSLILILTELIISLIIQNSLGEINIKCILINPQFLFPEGKTKVTTCLSRLQALQKRKNKLVKIKNADKKKSKDLTTLFTIAQNDQDKNVQEAAKVALEKLAQVKDEAPAPAPAQAPAEQAKAPEKAEKRAA